MSTPQHTQVVFKKFLVSEIMHCIFISIFFLATHMNKAMIEWSTRCEEEEERERDMIIVHKLLKAFSFFFAIIFSICASKKQNDKSYIVKYLSYWLNGLPTNYLLFIFAMGLFYWPITQKKDWKLGGSPK